MFGGIFNYIKKKSMSEAVARGERLCLCNIGLGFLRDFFEYSSSENVNKYTCISQDKRLISAFFSLVGIIKRTRLESDYKAFSIVEISSGKLVGVISLERIFYSLQSLDSESGIRTAELGYSINSAYWNRGFGYEALNLFIEYLKKDFGIKKFYARTVLENTASMRLLKKAGFERCPDEGKIRIRGRDYNLAIFRRNDG